MENVDYDSELDREADYLEHKDLVGYLKCKVAAPKQKA
jgi:hypothetical protein